MPLSPKPPRVLAAPSGPVIPSPDQAPETLDDAAWDAFVAGHPRGHLLQSSAWGRLREAQGWRMRRCAVRDARGIPLAGAQLLIRPRPLATAAYLPRGPVCEPGDLAWQPLLDRIRRSAGAAIAVRLEPHWEDSAASRRFLEGQGLRPAPPVQPPSTVRVDLALPEDALLAAMKPKWRYNVRLAARSGVQIVAGDAGDLPVFEALVADTTARQGIPARPPGYHAAVWRAFGPEHARLYLARLEDQVLAGILVIHFGDTATYLYGGSSAEERQRMPNHLLQWEAMRRARAAGLARYDFWGIPDAVGDAWATGGDPDAVPIGQGGLWGVWGFKRGFGGEVWRAVGAWDLVRAPVRYWIGQTLLPALRRRGRVGA